VILKWQNQKQIKSGIRTFEGDTGLLYLMIRLLRIGFHLG